MTNELKFKRENDEGIPLTPAESRRIWSLIWAMFFGLCGVIGWLIWLMS